jgi:hypothetical protein
MFGNSLTILEIIDLTKGISKVSVPPCLPKTTAL